MAILDVLDPVFFSGQNHLNGNGLVEPGDGTALKTSNVSLDQSFCSSDDSKSFKINSTLDNSFSDSISSMPVKNKVLKAKGCEINLGKYLLPGHSDSDSDDDLKKANMTKTEVVHYTESLIEEYWDSSIEKWIHPRTGKHLHMQEAIDCGILCPEIVRVKQANSQTINLQKAINSGQINVHTGKTINLKTALTWPFHVARAKGLVKVNDNEPMEKCDMYTELGPGVVSLIAKKQLLRDTKLLDKRLDQWLDIPRCVEGFIFDTEWGKVKDNMTGKWFTWDEAKEAGLILDPRVGEQSSMSEEEILKLTEEDNHIINLKEVTDEKGEKEYGGHILFNQNPAKLVTGRRQSVDHSDKFPPSLAQRRCSLATDNKSQLTTFPIMLDEAIKQGLYNPVTNKLRIPADNIEIPLESALQKGLINKESLVRDPVSRDILSLQEAIEKRIIDPDSGKMIDANEQAIALNFAFNTGLIMRSQSPLKLSMSEILDEGLFDEELGSFLNPDNNQEISFGEAIKAGLIDEDLVRVRNTDTGKVMKLDDAIEQGMVYNDSGVCVDMTNREKLQIPDSIERGILIDIANQPKMSLQCAIEEEVFNFETGTFRDNDLGIEVCLGDALESGLIDADSVLVRDPKTLTVLTIDAAVIEGIIDPESGWYSNDDIEIGFGEAIDKGLVLYNASHGVLPCSVLEAVRFNIYDAKSQKFIDPKSGKILTLEKAIESNLIDPRKTMVKDTSTGRFLSLMNAEYLGVVDVKKSEITDLKNNQQCELKTAKEIGLLRRSASEECLTLKTAISKGLVDKGQVQDVLSRQKMNLSDAIQIRIIDHAPTLVKDVREGKFVPLLDAIRKDLIDVEGGNFVDSETGKASSLIEACEMCNIIEIPTSGLTLAEIVEHSLYKPDTNSFLDVRTGKMISLQDGIEQRLIDASRPQVVVPGTGLFSLKEAFECGYLNKDTGNYILGGKEIKLAEAVEKFYVVTVGSKRRNKSMTDSYCEDLDDGKTWNDLLVKHPHDRMFISMEDAVEYGVIDIQTESYCDPKTGCVEPLNVAIGRGEVVDSANPKYGLAGAFDLKIFDPINNTVLDPITNEDVPLHDAMKCGLIDTTRTRVKDLETGNFVSLKQALKKGIVSDKTGSLLEKTQKRTFPIEAAVREGLIIDFTKSNFTVPEGISLGMITHDGLMVEDLNTGNYMCLDDAVARGIIDTYNTAVKQNEGEREITFAEAIEQNVVDENSGVMKLKTGRRMSLAEAVSKSYIVEKKDIDFFLGSENDMEDSLNIPSLDESNGIENFLPRILSSPLFKAESVSSLSGRSDSVSSPIRFDEALKFGFLDLETGDFTDYLTDSKMTIEQAASEGRLSIRKVSYYDEENKLSIPLKFALEKNLIFQASKDENIFENNVIPPKKGLTFQQALNKGLLTIQTDLSDSIDGDRLSVKSDTFSEMIVKNKNLDWLSPTKAVSSSLDSLIQNVKEDQSSFRVGTLFDAIEKGLYDQNDGTLKDTFTQKSMKIKEAMNSGLISPKVPEILDPKLNEYISLEEAVERNLVDSESGMFNNPVSNEKLTLANAKEEGYIIKTKSNLQSKSSVEIYVEEILTNENTRGKNKLQEAFSTGVLNRSKSQVIDPDMVKPITIRRAGSLGMIDAKTGEFKNPQTGEYCSLSEAVQKGFILSPKGLSLYSAVNQGLYSEESGLFRDPESGKELSLNSLIDRDIVTDGCMEIRDVKRGGSLIKMKEAIKRGVIDSEKGKYISENLELNFKEAISAGLIISNIPREGLRESSNNVQTVVGDKPDQIWKSKVPNKETLKDGPCVTFIGKDSKKHDDPKVTSSTSSMETNSSGYETNMSQNQNNADDDIRFAVEIDQLKSKQVYLNVEDREDSGIMKKKVEQKGKPEKSKKPMIFDKKQAQMADKNLANSQLKELPKKSNTSTIVNAENKPDLVDNKKEEKKIKGTSTKKTVTYGENKKSENVKSELDKNNVNVSKSKSDNNRMSSSSDMNKVTDSKTKNGNIKLNVTPDKNKVDHSKTNENTKLNSVSDKTKKVDSKTINESQKSVIASDKDNTNAFKTDKGRLDMLTFESNDGDKNSDDMRKTLTPDTVHKQGGKKVEVKEPTMSKKESDSIDNVLSDSATVSDVLKTAEDIDEDKSSKNVKQNKLIEKLNIVHNGQNGSFDQELSVPSPVLGHRSLVSPVRSKEFTFHAGVPQSVLEERQVYHGMRFAWHCLVYAPSSSLTMEAIELTQMLIETVLLFF